MKVEYKHFYPAIENYIQHITLVLHPTFLSGTACDFHGHSIDPLPIRLHGTKSHAGEQVAQWDFQNKGRSRWTGTNGFVEFCFFVKQKIPLSWHVRYVMNGSVSKSCLYVTPIKLDLL